VSDRLLFVVRRLPVPAWAGASIRSRALLLGLAREFDVVFVCLRSPADEPVTSGDVAAALPGIEVITVPARRTSRRVAQVLSLAGSSSAAFGRESTAALRQRVHAEALARDASVVHYDDVTAALAGPVPGRLNAFAPHNVEHRILDETARHTQGLRKMFAGVDGRKLRREEHRLWRTMDVCVAVSELDGAAMRRGGASRVILCPNGTDPVPRLPVPALAPGEALRILFVGAGSYGPNRAGLRWLLDEVLPRLDGTPLTVDVVGTRPGTLDARPGITLHGKVPSVDPYYAAAHVAVVPILYGSGTRLKIVEAMAWGIPAVSTAVGAEGLPIERGTHFLGGEDAEGFAGALLEVAERLRGEGPPMEPLLARARATAELLFWPRLSADLAAAYRAAIAG
jgi:glycosyltransferase involved in cell wall biosynthesis